MLDTDALELYIEQTAAVNMFLSHSYFKSKACLREVHAVVDKAKPFMLTHEADKAKGGGPRVRAVTATAPGHLAR